MPYIGTGRISLFFEEAGNGGIPLLLLHELGGSSESWREVIRLLATDRRVLAVDMRCAGRSEKPPGAFALADVADDLDELLRALNLEGPVDVAGALRRRAQALSPACPDAAAVFLDHIC